MRKDMVMIMKRVKKIVEDVCVYGACLISLAVLFNEICNWMLYV